MVVYLLKHYSLNLPFLDIQYTIFKILILLMFLINKVGN